MLQTELAARFTGSFLGHITIYIKRRGCPFFLEATMLQKIRSSPDHHRHHPRRAKGWAITRDRRLCPHDRRGDQLKVRVVKVLKTTALARWKRSSPPLPTGWKTTVLFTAAAADAVPATSPHEGRNSGLKATGCLRTSGGSAGWTCLRYPSPSQRRGLPQQSPIPGAEKGTGKVAIGFCPRSHEVIPLCGLLLAPAPLLRPNLDRDPGLL